MKINIKITLVVSLVFIILIGISYAWLRSINSSSFNSFIIGEVDIAVFVSYLDKEQVTDPSEIRFDGNFDAPVVFADVEDTTFDDVIQIYKFKVENYSNVSIKLLIDHEISDNQSGISYVILPIVDISNLDEGFTYKNYLTSKIEEVIDEDIGDVLERCKDQIELQKVLNDVSTNTINSLTKVEEDNSFSDKEFESNQENLIAEFLLMMWCEFYVGDTIPTLDDDLVYLNDTVTIKVEGLQYAYTE